MRRLALLGCCFALILVSASSAQAAQRYASPTGSGTECTQPKPCSFNEAVGKAGAGDEVIVLGGTYSLSATATLPFAATGAQVHGDPSGPIPKIKGAFLGYLLVDVAPKSRVSFLEFENTSSEFAFGSLCAGVESIFERIRAVSIGKYATGIALENCLVRDSLAFASGQLSVGLTGTTNVPGTAVGTAVNVTAIASGPESVAVRSTTGPFPGSSYTLTVKNSIALGTTDVEAMPAFGNSTLLTIAASNYRSHKETPPSHVIDVGGNQSALPIFVDSASGDFREAAGSPTIDAGFPDPQAGTLDLAGNARTQGGAIDIGAYEVVVPPAPPVLAGQLQSLAVAPVKFRAVNAGEAIFSAARKKRAPIGATVTYGLSAAGTVAFAVERKTIGRKAGRKCVKRTKANAKKKKCPLYRKVRGSFGVNGAAGQNSFKFTGRIAGKGLKPGRYRLVGVAGGVTKTAAFRIVK